MYVAVGGIEDLLRWFDTQGGEETLLCLLVPKDPDDEKLLRDLFNARALVGPRLAKVALCLFTSEPSDLMLARDPSHSDFLFVPGLRQVQIDMHWPYEPGKFWKPLQPEVAHTLPVQVREEVVLRTEVVGSEIAHYFELEESDPPCVIFVARKDRAPFVVRTKGGADLDALRSLLAEMDRLGQLVQESGMLSIPALAADRRRLLQARDSVEGRLEESTETAAAALTWAAEVASSYGLSNAIRGIDPKFAHQLFRYLGLPHRDKRPLPVPQEVRENAAAALLDPSIHAAFREAIAAGKTRRKIELQLESIDRDIASLNRRLDRDQLSSKCATVEDEINAICVRYEKKFRRARQLMSLRKFLLLLSGAAKATQELTTLVPTAVDAAAQILPRGASGP